MCILGSRLPRGESEMKKYDIQCYYEDRGWITLKNYVKLSEHKAKWYIDLTNMAKNYLTEFRELRMVETNEKERTKEAS
jgi:hypothetical protein